MQTSMLSEDAKLARIFLCRNAQEPPTDFKRMDTDKVVSNTILRQRKYVSKLKSRQNTQSMK